MEPRAAVPPVESRPFTVQRTVQAGFALIVESLRRHRVLVALVLPYTAACYAVGLISGGSAVVDIGLYNGVFGTLLAVLTTILVLVSVIRVMAQRPAGSLYETIWHDLWASWLSRRRISNVLVPLLLTPLFFSTFSSFKALIPFVAPFSWDETFMRWDRWLHGGTDPWALLQPLLGISLMTTALNAVYNGWFFAMFFVLVWQIASTKRAALRMQFLISFLLCWIVIGTGLAMLFSSAGPCYYVRITGLPDPYVPLMQYLHAAAEEVPVWALATQEMLWQAYQEKSAAIGAGISAMPSMHVAIAVLLALFGWRLNRWAGIALTVFALLIMLGSVHLAWHYAIDSYVAALAGAAIWYGVGWALRCVGIVDELRAGDVSGHPSAATGRLRPSRS